MLFSDVDGRKVVSTNNAETVGKVDDFVIDPSSRSVVALHLKKTENGDTLTWPNITAVGEDAVTVTDSAKIMIADGRVAELKGKDHRAVGKRVLTDLGDELGKVTDVDFDPASGDVTVIHLKNAQVPGSALIGIGSYAVVVQAG